jgi:2-desacetyl-2-hydroxyethyl bacteriochlorophyllide A dehydrogenase
MPEVSIIIRTYNEGKHIGNLLSAIKKQQYKDYEIIVVDSGSSDNTLDIASEFKTKIVKIESRDFTFGYSLNVGCAAASGQYFVLASAHVIPQHDRWLSNIVAPFQDKKVAMVYGRHLPAKQTKFSERQDFKRLFVGSSVNSKVPLEYANNANSAVRASLWKKRRFDEYLFGLEDIDWARAMVKQDLSIFYEPKAAVYHIHEEEWHQVFNRYRREAIAARRIGLAHPPQARVEPMWMVWRIIVDLVTSFPNWKLQRVEEILRFRYYQWKGSRLGWAQAPTLDLNKEKETIFYSVDNKSVVIKDKDKAEYGEVKLPELKPGDVLLSVDYVGICRTDLEVLEGALGYYRDGVANYPIVPGHEFSATVVRTGANSRFQERLTPGKKVVGECILSRDPKNRKEVGVINYNGAYSNYIVMPGDALQAVPEDLDQKTAAMTEPLAVVLRAIRRIKSRLNAKSEIAVIGAGPIGNLAAQALSADGYSVTVLDKNKQRLKLLESRVKNTSTEIRNLGNFDAIIEATGSKDILERVIRESKGDGTIMLLGFPYGNISYNFEDLVGHEKVIAGSVGGEREDFLKALKLLPKLSMAPFTKVVLPLKEFDKAWELHRTGKYLKILLKP